MSASATLVSCPDCNHQVSQYAEACPSCGRFFRSYARTAIEVSPGAGWVGKVAWGIVLSSFLWGAILVLLFIAGIVLLVVLAGVGGAMSPDLYRR